MSSRLLCRLLVAVAFGLVLAGCDEPQDKKYNGSMDVQVLLQPVGGAGLDSVMCSFTTVMHRTDPDSVGDDIVLEGLWGYADNTFWGQTAWYLNTKTTGITQTMTVHGYNGANVTGKLHFEWRWEDDKGEHFASTDTVICTTR